VRRIEAAKNHWLHGLKSGKRFARRALIIGDGITDARLLDFLDTCHEEAYIPSLHLRHLDGSRSVNPYPCDLEDSAARHHPDLHALANSTVEDSHHHDRTVIRIEPTIDDQRSQWRTRISRGRGKVADDTFENLLSPNSFFGTGQNGAGGIDSNHILDFFFNPFGIRA